MLLNENASWPMHSKYVIVSQRYMCRFYSVIVAIKIVAIKSLDLLSGHCGIGVIINNKYNG